MSRVDVPAGGTCYYGHSTDSGNDFTTAMGLVTGTYGHIRCSQTSTAVVLKYDWMDNDHWIMKLQDSTSGFGYSVYQSTTGDIYAYFTSGSTPVSNPIYAFPSYGTHMYYWHNTTGVQTTDNVMNLIRVQATDVMGSDEGYLFMTSDSSGSDLINHVVGYPSGISSATTQSRYNTVGNTTIAGSFAILGPLTSPLSKGVSTYARFVYQQPTTIIGAGSYTVAGYKFQMIDTRNGIIALRNDASS